MNAKIINDESEAASISSSERVVVKCIGGHASAHLAQRAMPVSVTIADENAVISAIETRLTQEILNLTGSLERFGSISKDISEELPDSAQFGKLVTRLLSLLCFQFSNSLLKDMDKPLLLSDGGEYIQKLGLSLDEAFREIELEGRQFLAVALINESLADGS